RGGDSLVRAERRQVERLLACFAKRTAQAERVDPLPSPEWLVPDDPRRALLGVRDKPKRLAERAVVVTPKGSCQEKPVVEAQLLLEIHAQRDGFVEPLLGDSNGGRVDCRYTWAGKLLAANRVELGELFVVLRADRRLGAHRVA